MTKHLYFPECTGNPVFPSIKPHIYFEGVIPAGLNDTICILKFFGEQGPLLLELMNDIISIIRH